MDSFIQFKDVKKTYKVGDIEIHASNGVNFEVNKGEFVVIVGPSGAGKTTILNLLGGMDLYLQQNTGRIKKYLVDMFNIGSDISTIIGNFSVAVAEIFSVFRSDSAKQVTADLIGIFSSSFQGVTELGAKFIRDLLNIITKPITDNADQIKARIQAFYQQRSGYVY